MQNLEQRLPATLYQRFNIIKVNGQNVPLPLFLVFFLAIFAAFVYIPSNIVWQIFIAICILATLIAGSYQYVKVTALLKLENCTLKVKIMEQNKLLAASQKQFEELSHIMSHDLKEPLRSIAGFTSLIDKRLKKANCMDDEITDYVTHIHTGIHRLDALMKNVRAYLTIGIIKSARTEVSMRRLIEQVAEKVRNQDDVPPVKIVVNKAEDVYGDPAMLEELFVQLLSNAIKYRNPDLTPRINIGCSSHNGRVEYYVQDNGIGINKKYHCVIFEAFKCLHSKLKYEGTGVGLAICKKIVGLHGGDIWVKSKEPDGSTFYFTLPKAA